MKAVDGDSFTFLFLTFNLEALSFKTLRFQTFKILTNWNVISEI